MKTIFTTFVVALLTTDLQPAVSDPKVTLDSLDDMEVLTYFLLWRYNYFRSAEEINGMSFDSSDSSFGHTGNDIDSKLLLLIENLKDNKLMQYITNSSQTPAIDAKTQTCDNLDKRLYEKWESKISVSKIKSLCEAASGCKSSRQLIDLIDNSPSKPLLLSNSIVRLCPLILFQLQEHQCIEQRESHYKALNRPSAGAVWGFGLLFVTIVSFCSLIGVAILPLLTKSTYDVMLTLFEGLAVGSLVGSAIFHLIPQAFNLSGHGSHAYLWKALIIFGGIYLFFWSERIMKMVVEFRRKRKFNIQSVPSCTSAELEPHKAMAPIGPKYDPSVTRPLTHSYLFSLQTSLLQRHGLRSTEWCH